jgi:hypothetical protein
MVLGRTMFDKLKIKLDHKADEKPKETKETATEAAEKPQPARKPIKKAKKTQKPDNPPEPAAPKEVHAEAKEFVGIKEYGSATQIEEHLDKEIAATKSALGEYLRQMDDVRGAAERSKRLYDIVSKATGKKQSMEKTDQIAVNGLEIVLDATPLNQLTAIESVVRSHQQRLLTLQKAKDALKTLDQAGDTEGILYLVLEREGIPEQILLKLS